MSRDYGLEAQEAAEAHLEELHMALDAENEGAIVDWPDMAGPFCGCTICEVRETLFAAWPLLLEAAREEAAAP